MTHANETPAESPDAPATPGGPGGRPEGLLTRLDALVLRHPVVVLAGLFPVALLAGFALTRGGTSTWDSVAHLDHARWLLGMWHGVERPLPYETMRWIGPLWEYVLAASAGVFAFLHDPLWVRHAVTFSLLPLTLLATYHLLRRGGETPGTALLAVALVAGNVRFLGHALLNVKDFPLACGYLLVTLAMWAVLHDRILTPAGLLRRPAWLVGLVLLSVVPYLLRVPLLVHWLVLVALSIVVGLSGDGRAGWVRRGTIALLPLVLGPVVVFVLMPGLWGAGPFGFVSVTRLFSRFPWHGPVRFFGEVALSSELPWWYGPVWIAVSWVPIGLLVLLIGGVLFVPLLLREAARGRAGGPLLPLFASLPLWVALFAALPWVAVISVHPVLYDEDRHLLFAMPLLAIAAALGLRAVSERSKAVVAGLVLLSAAWSAASWGQYAYVYRDPLLPRSADEDFMGDYWHVSTGALAQALCDRVPEDAYVFVMGPGATLAREIERRETSLLFRRDGHGPIRLRQKPRRRGQFFVAAFNRNGAARPLLEDIAAGRARELWREEMPRGGIAALLAYYDDRCEDCPQRLSRQAEGYW